MRKICFYIIILLGTLLGGNGKYMTRTGFVSFFSSTPLEDIYSENNKVSCMLNIKNGELDFIIPVDEFQFEKTLMGDHFNENYLETEKFPTSTFIGQIESWDNIRQLDSSNVVVNGHIMIHGVKKNISEIGYYKKKKNSIIGEATFRVVLKDYGIKIPSILFNNIAEIIDITIRVKLKEVE